jgi:hypothetical protein
MKTPRPLRFAAGLAAAVLLSSSLVADTAETITRAVEITQRMIELNQKFAAFDVALTAPDPLQGAKGKYLLPIDANGALTGWAQKALQAQVGNIAGEQAGAAASKGLASVVPGGGLAGGFLKKKGKEAGAMAALGGPDYVKKTSSLSFDSVEAYAVYLHAKLGSSPEYSKAVQAAIALYPDLEASYGKSVTAAYEAAKTEALIKKAAADALAAKEQAEKAATAAPAVTVEVTPTSATVTAPAASATATP